jgi:hypothetical protein
MLGNTEEIVTFLEDSMVNIATIAGSKYVGPIREEVEKWQQDLLTFQVLHFVLSLYIWQSCTLFVSLDSLHDRAQPQIGSVVVLLQRQRHGSFSGFPRVK